MSDEVLETFIRQYIDASPGPEVSFVWHGGEPSLAGLDFYRRAVALQQCYLPPGWVCWNNLQTNGVLLDDEWCEFLADNHFDVGLSIDGASWIHDEYRKDAHGDGTYATTADAIRRLQAHGVNPDLLCTVTSTTAQAPLEVYRTLRGFGTGWIQFIPIVRRDESGQVTPDSVSGEDYGDFLVAVFDEWVHHDLGRTDVQFFAETMRVLAGAQPGLCWMAPTCGRALIVESDGGVYSCDHFVNADHRLGDLAADGLGTLADSPAQVRFGDAKQTGLPDRCRSCEWLALCHGACPKDRTDDGTNLLCAGLDRFFSHAVPTLTQVVQRTRRGETPAAIMGHLREQAMAMWEGVGRNDPCPCGSGLKAKNCCWPKRP